jgi:hypothetical protein|tara:strand:- start:161 stop:721 length:561 start_codon:yes stop_codon:yes gene_type:complete
MPIAINGSGSITGISAGGLPDGCVTADDLASGVGGKILQVVQATSDSKVSTTSSSYVDTPLSQAITPTATSNKILIRFKISASTNNGTNLIGFQIVRGSTAIGNGSQGSSRRFCHSAFRGQYSDSHPHAVISGEFLDSPSTTSATTYKIQFQVDGATGFINRDNTDADGVNYPSPLSTLTLMEVSA